MEPGPFHPQGHELLQQPCGISHSVRRVSSTLASAQKNTYALTAWGA
ncbi:MAG: hypothetical protein HC904_04890 [Blastochloris sp.]|nr:hypothetical protein [Blastochloris sp.]